IVALSVHREGEYVVVAIEDRCCAVALMHVESDDGGAFDRAFGAQPGGRDRYFIDDAEAFTVIGEGMVRAAGEIAREPCLEGRACRQQSSGAGDARAPPQRL